VVELTRQGERRAEEGTLPPLLRTALNLGSNHLVFIPCKTYVSGGRRTTVHLMEGYAFVASYGEDLSYPLRGEQLYIKRLLTAPSPKGTRVLSVVPDAVVSDMEEKLAQYVGDDVVEGLQVRVQSGLFAQMRGEVVDLTTTGNLLVRFQMRSLDTIVEIPRSFAVPDDGTDDEGIE
jgi:hypothetical protein